MSILGLCMVVHTYNPSYSEGRSQSEASESVRPHQEKQMKAKRAGGMAQVIECCLLTSRHCVQYSVLQKKSWK
jgi:hypothetical protein